MVSTNYILSTYGISKEYGFLSENIATKLPVEYQEWENIATDFQALINANSLRNRLDNLRLITDPIFKTKAERERAMLLLSFFGHAYIFGWNDPVDELPASIAIPWTKVADKLGRKPILSHASAVLNNWKLIDNKKPFSIYNITTIIQFQGSIDESWFFLMTAVIEKNGAVAIKYIVDAILAVKKDDEHEVSYALGKIKKVLNEITQNLKDIRKHCDPYVFYHRVRPFLASFENVKYNGSEDFVRSYHGGSAAQSSLIQMFDAAFGIRHHHPFLQEMRNYMPPLHADFLKFLEFKSKLKDFCNAKISLQNDLEECIELLLIFRNEHLKIAAEYIIAQQPKSQKEPKGTGGTNPMIFLKEIRDGN
ncbi:MAG: indoleamine 2,3-dioxygenase [Maribacter sp.]|jgi:indoleamine 2,3-dioxygenase